MNFTDAGDVLLTGQNPFISLFGQTEPKPHTTASFWRVDLSPAGPGHALFLLGEITGNTPLLFTDNIALARYIQEEIYGNNRGMFSHFKDASIDLHDDAKFRQSGDARSFIREEVMSRSHSVSLSWYDFLPAFKGGTAADPAAGKMHAHYALYIPARRARLTLDGKHAQDGPRPMQRGSRQSMSCALAWAETWVKPAEVSPQSR